MLAKYPTKKEWRLIQFSDEVHVGFGGQYTLQIIRKPGQRYCPDCLQHGAEPSKDSDRKRQHAWAAVGYNFKSPLVWYEIPSNTNGKMTQLVYRDQILEAVVRPWLQAGQQFVLEEDGDSGHGPEKENLVRKWKEENGLKLYFNYHDSPDLSPIENCWQAPKQNVNKYPHWDDYTVRELMEKGWEDLRQETINAWIDSMS